MLCSNIDSKARENIEGAEVGRGPDRDQEAGRDDQDQGVDQEPGPSGEGGRRRKRRRRPADEHHLSVGWNKQFTPVDTSFEFDESQCGPKNLPNHISAESEPIDFLQLPGWKSLSHSTDPMQHIK